MDHNSPANTDPQVEKYLALIGEKLAVDVVTIYKLSRDHSHAFARIIHQWRSDPPQGLQTQEQLISLDKYNKTLLEKINKRSPFEGCYSEYKDSFPFSHGLEYKSFMFTPIEIDDSPWGFIVCLDLKKKRKWLAEDLFTLMEISRQAAVAISKGQEYELLLHKSGLYNLFFESLEDVSFTLDTKLTIKECGGHLRSTGIIKESAYKGKYISDIFLFSSQADKEDFDKNCSILARERHGFKALLNTFPGSRWVFIHGIPVSTPNDSQEIVCTLTDVDRLLTPLLGKADLLKLLSYNSNSIFIYWNSMREPEFVTKSIHSITGYTPQEAIMVLKNEMDYDVGLISKSDITLLNEALVRVQDLGQKDPERMELELSNRQGAPVYVSTTINPVHDSEGNVTGYIAEMRDVTENELISQMEKKLIESVNIPPSSPTYIFHLDSKGIAQYANHHLLKMLPAGSLLGKNISEYLPATQKDTFFGEIISRRSTNDLSKIVLHSLKLERETKKMVTISAAIYKSGRPNGFLCIMKESNEIEGVHRGTYEENLAKTSSELIWMTDMQLKYIYVSPSVEYLLGVSPEEFMKITGDKNLTPKSHGLLGTAFEEGLKAAGNGMDSWKTNHEITYAMKKGRMSGILTLSLIIENKKPKGFMGVVTFPARRTGKASRNKY